MSSRSSSSTARATSGTSTARGFWFQISWSTTSRRCCPITRATETHVTAPPEADPFEALYARGVTDGLPVVAPTAARVAAAVEASGRPRDEPVALVAPKLGRGHGREGRDQRGHGRLPARVPAG